MPQATALQVSPGWSPSACCSRWTTQTVNGAANARLQPSTSHVGTITRKYHNTSKRSNKQALHSPAKARLHTDQFMENMLEIQGLQLALIDCPWLIFEKKKTSQTIAIKFQILHFDRSGWSSWLESIPRASKNDLECLRLDAVTLVWASSRSAGSWGLEFVNFRGNQFLPASSPCVSLLFPCVLLYHCLIPSSPVVRVSFQSLHPCVLAPVRTFPNLLVYLACVFSSCFFACSPAGCCQGRFYFFLPDFLPCWEPFFSACFPPGCMDSESDVCKQQDSSVRTIGL